MVAPRDKHEEEDAVIAALLSHLHGNDVPATLLETPDRMTGADRTYPALTSDALIDLQVDEEPAERWSIDVMAPAAPDDLGPTPAALHDRFTPLAEKFDVSFHFAGTMPRRHEVKRLAQLVGDAVRMGSSEDDLCKYSTGSLTVSWTYPHNPEAPVTMILLQNTESALLSDQLEESLSEPLLRKATKQATPAKTAGIKAAVIIDRIGHQGDHARNTLSTAVRGNLPHRR